MHYACFTIKLCVYFTVRGTYICVVLPVIVEKMSPLIAEPCLFVGSVKTTPNDTILTLVKTINHHDRFKKYTFCGRIYAYLMSKMLLNHRLAMLDLLQMSSFCPTGWYLSTRSMITVALTLMTTL